jgi:hypothetical protein
MANPAGTGLKPAKKGERLVGRKPGVPNRFTQDLKDAILGAAEAAARPLPHRGEDQGGAAGEGDRP